MMSSGAEDFMMRMEYSTNPEQLWGTIEADLRRAGENRSPEMIEKLDLYLSHIKKWIEENKAILNEFYHSKPERVIGMRRK